MAINKTINGTAKSYAGMRNCIEYILKGSKTQDGLIYITGPYMEDVIDFDKVYNSFRDEKRLWHKEKGRLYYHNVISFHKDEKITPEEAFEFGRQFAEEWFDGFQTVMSVHIDRDHIHVHMVTNSVSYIDGKKYHQSRRDLAKMKTLTNKMCKDRNLTISEKGRHFDGTPIMIGEITSWAKNQYRLLKNNPKDSYLSDCINSVYEALEKATSRDEFIKAMNGLGWKVNWTDKRKYITFENNDGKKIRDSKLAKVFNTPINKEVLELVINKNFEDNGAKASTVKSINDNSARDNAIKRVEELNGEIHRLESDVNKKLVSLNNAIENKNKFYRAIKAQSLMRKYDNVQKVYENIPTKVLKKAYYDAHKKELDSYKRARSAYEKNKLDYVYETNVETDAVLTKIIDEAKAEYKDLLDALGKKVEEKNKLINKYKINETEISNESTSIDSKLRKASEKVKPKTKKKVVEKVMDDL